jgi:hypothetical protein
MLTPEESKDTQAKNARLVTYWQNALKRAKKKQPERYWEAAEKRLNATAAKELDNVKGFDQRPVVNDLRNHFEGSMAYLDQRAPAFTVSARPAFADDEAIIKRAECERKYIEYVWAEQKCQQAESQKLTSSIVRNVGFTVPVFDLKKWMPGLKYLPSRDVRFDPDCGGILENVSWQAYKEDISIEELKAITELDKEEIENLKGHYKTSLSEEDVEEATDDVRKENQLVTLWHIFARNDAAIRFVDEDEDTPKRLAEELNLNTPRRYIQLVEGLQRPIKNVDKWPFELDHNELMITHLQMNKEPENLYGFTDYQQMERMDEYSDLLMSYIEADAYFASIKKFASGEKPPGGENIDDFINKNTRSVLENFLDENGTPKLQPVKVGEPTPGLTDQYNLMHGESSKASGLSELMQEGVADYKEVTAIAVRYQAEKLHQRINLRLGGPRGYEESIKEDAVKLLEIAHQMVPKLSHVSVMETVEVPGEVVDDIVVMEEEETEVIKVLPWPDALKAIMGGGQLLKLGIDAIVGEELAQYWVTTDDVPLVAIRLSTEIAVDPGSTRTITDQQKAAEMKAFATDTLLPLIYEPTGRIDLAVKYARKIGRYMGIDKMEEYLPSDDEVSDLMKDKQQQAESEEAEKRAAAEAKVDLADTKLETAERKADNEERAADAELVRAGAKAEMELGKGRENGA